MIVGGGLSGGIASSIAGGDFGHGMLQGLITSVLNGKADMELDGLEQEGSKKKTYNEKTQEEREYDYIKETLLPAGEFTIKAAMFREEAKVAFGLMTLVKNGWKSLAKNINSNSLASDSLSIDSKTVVNWNLGDGVVTKAHHNWNKIFGNRRVLLEDVTPIVKIAVKRGTWEVKGVIRLAKGIPVGDKVEIIQNIQGHKIWVGGMREYSTGILHINNAAVK